MPLIIPEDIPAYEFLKEHAFVMGVKRAERQDIRPLEVLLINLMPTKIETEKQILSLLANSPLQVRITLLTTQSYIGKNTPQSHLSRFYKYFSDIAHQRFDGAIVTGAPIEHLEFENVVYWNEMKEIMEYLKNNSTSTMYLCWGAMAGLYHFHKIKKIMLKEKVFGVFSHRIVKQDLLLNGLDSIVKMPHSRHAGIDERSVRESNLKILLESDMCGVSALKDEKDFYILAHPEYAKDTLLLEYERDKNKGLEIKKPIDYFGESGEPILSWKSSASVLFLNWLNFSVYQDTAFVL